MMSFIEKRGFRLASGRGGRERASPGPGGPPGSANPRWYCAESRWTALHAVLATSFSRRVRHRALDTRRAVRRFRRVSARLGSWRAPFSPFRGACHAPQRPSRAAGRRLHRPGRVPGPPDLPELRQLLRPRLGQGARLRSPPGLQGAAPAHPASAGGGGRGLPVALRRRRRPHLRADRHRVVLRPARGGLPLHPASARHADRVRVDARAPHPHGPRVLRPARGGGHAVPAAHVLGRAAGAGARPRRDAGVRPACLRGAAASGGMGRSRACTGCTWRAT